MLKKILNSPTVKEFDLVYAVRLKIIRKLRGFKKLNLTNYKFRAIYRYLNRYYKKGVCKNNLKEESDTNFKVFVCWWQGLDNDTPLLVKKCIESIKNNFLRHEVIIIDKNNYTNYTTIPAFILKKFEQGRISMTHFSDILRMSLISDNGGCWIDATCLFTDSPEEELEKYDFYTNKLNCKKVPLSLEFVTKGNFITRSASISIILRSLLAAPDG